MAVGKGYGNKPVYARFEDTIDTSDPRSAKLRKTTVWMKQDDPETLMIGTIDNKFRPDSKTTRLTVEQARQLRDAIDEFLADQDRPAEDFAFTPPPACVPGDRRKQTV